MNVFRLDLESLLPLLETFQQNGSLSTSLPAGSLKQKGPSKVKIDLLQGKIVYCHIEDGTGHIYVLDNPKKIRSTLSGLGEREWHLDEGIDKLSFPPGSQPLTQMSPAPQSAQRLPVPLLVPKVTTTPDARILNSLSRNQRRVLVLVDGGRSVKKITEILFPSSQDMRTVLQVLHELESLGLIVMGG